MCYGRENVSYARAQLIFMQEVRREICGAESEGGQGSRRGGASGEIKDGFVVLIGVGLGDTKAVAEKMVKKLLGLRIFADEEGKPTET